MNAEQLAAIKARAEAATAGPWHVVGLPWNNGQPYVIAGSEDPHFGTFVADTESTPTDEDDDERDRTLDAEFIAHARTDVPALLAEVERLTKDRDYWHDTYQQAANAHDEFLGELLKALPGDHAEMLCAYAEVLNGVERLVKELTEIHGDIRFCLQVIFDGQPLRSESVLAARRSRLIGLSIPHGGVYDPKTTDGGETP